MERGGGRGWRVSVVIEVREGWERAWVRTSWPMKPVVPVRMSFIFNVCVLRELLLDDMLKL